MCHVYQIHAKLKGKTVVIQKPLTEHPEHDLVVEWLREAFDASDLAGCQIDYVAENDDKFIGALTEVGEGEK